MFMVDLFKPRRRLEAENLFLRHQLSIALRRAPPRLRLRGSDRALLVWMTRLWPNLLGAAKVVQPETILRWHRAGFTAFWRWKSRKRAGRPKIDRGLRDLIRRMSRENSEWGASRIHGELLMLGFEVAHNCQCSHSALACGADCHRCSVMNAEAIKRVSTTIALLIERALSSVEGVTNKVFIGPPSDPASKQAQLVLFPYRLAVNSTLHADPARPVVLDIWYLLSIGTTSVAAVESQVWLGRAMLALLCRHPCRLTTVEPFAPRPAPHSSHRSRVAGVGLMRLLLAP
jgi:hypothetical protein